MNRGRIDAKANAAVKAWWAKWQDPILWVGLCFGGAGAIFLMGYKWWVGVFAGGRLWVAAILASCYLLGFAVAYRDLPEPDDREKR